MAYLQVSDDAKIEYVSQFANGDIETDIKTKDFFFNLANFKSFVGANLSELSDPEPPPNSDYRSLLRLSELFEFI